MIKGQYFYVPLEELTEPQSGECLVDMYWIVHPQYGALFWVPMSKHDDPYPGANKNELIVQRFLREDQRAVFLKAAYLSRARKHSKDFLAMHG